MSTMTTEDQTYEGWKNYPTWCVNLWLSNDEGLYNRTIATLEMAKEAYEDEEADRTWRLFVADWIHDYIVNDVLGDAFDADQHGQSQMADDLAQWALGQVDWLELADSWIES